MAKVLVSDAEQVRKKYRPKKIDVLFVGESAPAGGTFFYLENSQLYKYMRKAFGGGGDFLKEFKGNGYYLDDLILVPANRMRNPERKKLGWHSVPSLAKRLKLYQPSAVVAVMSAIAPMVLESLKQAGMSELPFYVTPFPGSGQQRRFLQKMEEILPKLQPTPDGGRVLIILSTAGSKEEARKIAHALVGAQAGGVRECGAARGVGLSVEGQGGERGGVAADHQDHFAEI